MAHYNFHFSIDGDLSPDQVRDVMEGRLHPRWLATAYKAQMDQAPTPMPTVTATITVR